MYSFTAAARNVEKRDREAEPEKKRSRNVSKAFSQGGPMDMSRTFSDLEAAGVVFSIWSEVLGETILLTPEAYQPRPGDPVSYTYEEARLLLEAVVEGGEEEARRLHLFKKAMRGKLTRKEAGANE